MLLAVKPDEQDHRHLYVCEYNSSSTIKVLHQFKNEHICHFSYSLSTPQIVTVYSRSQLTFLHVESGQHSVEPCDTLCQSYIYTADEKAP